MNNMNMDHKSKVKKEDGTFFASKLPEYNLGLKLTVSI